MSFRNHYIFTLVLLACQAIASAQTPPPADKEDKQEGPGASNGPGASSEGPRSTPAPALTGVIGIDAQLPEQDTSSSLPQIPALLGGPKLSVELRSETERSNYLRGGINVGATYDDNTLLTPHSQLGDTTYSVFPNIDLELVRSRMSWKLDYAAGLTVNQRLSTRNQASHDLSFESQFRLSPHVSLRIAEDFFLTTGSSDAVRGAGTDFGNGGPNASVLTPVSQQRSTSTVAEVNYHFALNDVVGASGSYYNLHFNDIPQGFILSDSRTASGSAFWLHGFGRNWLGVDYRFQRVTFDPVEGNSVGGETRVHSILAVDTIKLPNRFSVDGFIGPEHSENRGLVVGGSGAPQQFSDWSLSAGVDVGWQKDHTSVAVGYSRQISDGGGVLGVVRLQGVHGSVRQQLFPGWAVGFGASYGRNDSVTLPTAGSPSSVNSASVGASVERNLGRSLSLRAGYNHDFQEQIGVTDPAQQGSAHRNRVSVTLGYQWSRPLGR